MSGSLIVPGFCAPTPWRSAPFVGSKARAVDRQVAPKRLRWVAVTQSPPPRSAVSSRPVQAQRTLIPSTENPTHKRPKGRAAPKRDAELHVSSDRIDSTPVQKAMVYGFGCLTAAVFAKVGIAAYQSPATAGASLAAIIAGYLFADFGTGVYHFFVDNYGNEKTPVVGYQIAAFQGHHKSPWTITARDFANNLYRLTVPTSPQMLALLLLPIPPAVAAGLASALFFIVASQELHKQAHMQRPDPYARWLQDRGLAISRREHGLHHSAPYDGHYCIVSGLWNPLLDNTNFFRRLEAFIYRTNGVEPITWKLDPKLREEALSL